MAIKEIDAKGEFSRDNLYPAQAHETWEIILLLQGTGIGMIGGKEYPFEPGTIFCIPPGVVHQNIPDTSYRDICLLITEPIIPGVNEVLVMHDDEYHTMQTLLEIQRRTFAEKKVNYLNVSTSIQYTIQHLLISWLKQKKPNEYLDGLVELMRSNISNCSFSVTEAIERIPLTSNYTRKQFKAIFGCAPVTYMNQLRIDEAKKTLMADSLPISEVALKCGFDDTKYFTRLFKQDTGMSPTAYRKHHLRRLQELQNAE